MSKSQESPWIFLINLEIAPTFLKLAPKLYYNQFLIYFYINAIKILSML
jgi:hypothetical protein